MRESPPRWLLALLLPLVAIRRVLMFLLFCWTVLRIVWLNVRVVLIDFRLNKPKRLERRRRRLMDRVDRLESRLIDLGW